MNRRVTVIMPAWNAAPTIASSIRSALAQTYDDLHILVIDDGSVDSTSRIVTTMAARDSRVSLVADGRRRGPAGARNLGLELARGEYVAFLDSDDLWLPGKIAAQIAAMERQGTNVSCSHYGLILHDGTVPNFMVRTPPVVTGRMMRRRNYIGNLTGMFRRSATRARFPAWPRHEDYGFWIRVIADAGDCTAVPRALALYRLGQSSYSADKKRVAKVQVRIAFAANEGSLSQALLAFAQYAVNGAAKACRCRRPGILPLHNDRLSL